MSLVCDTTVPLLFSQTISVTSKLNPVMLTLRVSGIPTSTSTSVVIGTSVGATIELIFQQRGHPYAYKIQTSILPACIISIVSLSDPNSLNAEQVYAPKSEPDVCLETLNEVVSDPVSIAAPLNVHVIFLGGSIPAVVQISSIVVSMTTGPPGRC